MSSSPQRRPEPEREPAPATPEPAPRLRPREARGEDAPAPGDGEVARLHARLARAFASPRRTPLEVALVKALIVAATCVGLWNAIVGGGELLTRVLR